MTSSDVVAIAKSLCMEVKDLYDDCISLPCAMTMVSETVEFLMIESFVKVDASFSTTIASEEFELFMFASSVGKKSHHLVDRRVSLN